MYSFRSIYNGMNMQHVCDTIYNTTASSLFARPISRKPFGDVANSFKVYDD